eukprot:4638221-Prymnesium_polylepis.1
MAAELCCELARNRLCGLCGPLPCAGMVTPTYSPLASAPKDFGATERQLRSIRNRFVAQIHNCETARDMRETA